MGSMFSACIPYSHGEGQEVTLSWTHAVPLRPHVSIAGQSLFRRCLYAILYNYPLHYALSGSDITLLAPLSLPGALCSSSTAHHVL